MEPPKRAVVDAGFVLQIDAPDLAMERVLLYQDLTEAEFADKVEEHVDALNRALEGIPRDRVRLHVCWGNWEGPYCYDVPMEVVPNVKEMLGHECLDVLASYNRSSDVIRTSLVGRL